MSNSVTDKNTLSRLARRLGKGREYLLKEYPFFGRLLVHLKFGFAPCGTAYTDMESIVFDPDFLARLSECEMHFVILHEVMHCVLCHCVRGLTLNDTLYNVACDIVVNSFVLDAMGMEEFTVDGAKVMHRVSSQHPEGRCFTAEEVYRELLKELDIPFGEAMKNGCLDCHGPWMKVDTQGLSDMWQQHILNAAKYCVETGSGIPFAVKRVVEETEQKSKTDWRVLLRDFIIFDRADYTYAPPDKRYLYSDVILPSFNCSDVDGRLENVWFFADTSGSVTDEEIAVAYGEIKEAISQFDRMEGYVCFFDTKVSEPESFSSAEELQDITPVGGGGTSFFAVFDYIKNLPEDQKPAVAVIITDGHGRYPKEDKVPSVPLIWLLTDNSGDLPPLGEVVYLN